MADSKATKGLWEASRAQVRGAVGAVAAIVLVARAKDAKHLPRLILEQGSCEQSLKVLASSLVIFGYERLVAMILRRLNLTRRGFTMF